MGTSIQEENEYYTALGKFVAYFATAERAMYETVRELSGVSHDMGRALFSGVRTEAAIGYINRIMLISKTDQPNKDVYERLFNQLSEISKVRNLILHYGTQFRGEGPYYASNRAIALTPNHLKEIPVTAEILNQMTADLQEIQQRLLHLVVRRNPVGAAKLKGIKFAWESELRGAWRYTPPQPSSGRGKRRDSVPKR